MNKKVNEDALNALGGLIYPDCTEASHAMADDVLCSVLLQLGYSELVVKYLSVPRRF